MLQQREARFQLPSLSKAGMWRSGRDVHLPMDSRGRPGETWGNGNSPSASCHHTRDEDTSSTPSTFSGTPQCLGHPPMPALPCACGQLMSEVGCTLGPSGNSQKSQIAVARSRAAPLGEHPSGPAVIPARLCLPKRFQAQMPQTATHFIFTKQSDFAPVS